MPRVITAEPAMGKNRYLPAGGPPPGQREHADQAVPAMPRM